MEAGPPDLAETLRLFAKYRQQRRGASELLSNLTAEAEKRLEQIDWIVRTLYRLQALQQRVSRWDPNPETPSDVLVKRHQRRARAQHALGNQVQLLSESFYYFAWRLRQVLVQLPEFKKLDPKGIRDVRFHLLDHPEKDSRALNPNFMYGHDVPCGPVLKPFGSRDIDVHDRGLYVNARELLDELLPRLRKALGPGKAI